MFFELQVAVGAFFDKFLILPALFHDDIAQPVDECQIGSRFEWDEDICHLGGLGLSGVYDDDGRFFACDLFIFGDVQLEDRVVVCDVGTDKHDHIRLFKIFITPYRSI